MRILIARMDHETNTFSPVPTPLDRFFASARGFRSGEEALSRYTDTESCLGGFLDVCAEAGADCVCPIVAGAQPSGPVDDAAYEFIADRICDAVKAGCDAAMLELHGAMVSRSFEDGEGELLARIRRIAPELPIAVALDMHANLYEAMVSNATVIAGFKTYPHVDARDTGRTAGRVLLAAIRGEARPVMAWGNAPMLPHVMRQGTDDFPNSMLQERTREMEKEGALAATLFTGFPHADVANAGLSVVVATDNDRALAEQYRDELLDRAWEQRHAFVYRIEPLAESVARAKALGEKKSDEAGPVILLDHYDNTASGGTMDTTEVLAEILRQGLQDVAAFGIHDPECVRAMISAGAGREVELDLGGKMGIPALARQSRSLHVRGTVRHISDGDFQASGPVGKGTGISMGATVVLDLGGVDVVVVSEHVEPFDPGCFLSVGIDPRRRRHLMLKSRIHYRAAYREIASEIVECAGLGICTSDYGQLGFRHVRRPIFPLDDGLTERTLRPYEPDPESGNGSGQAASLPGENGP